MQETVNRKVSYKLYPSKAQEKLLGEFFELHRRLYNSMLEQRIMGWKSTRQSISFADQCKQITLLRKECSEFQALNAQSMQVTAKRLDLAYRSFFSRVKHGNTPGFPRFKSHDRFSGWGYKEHGDGWRIYTSQAKKVTNKQKTRAGFVRISGIGIIPLRGMARNEGTPKTMEVYQKAGMWFVSVTYQCTPERRSGTQVHAFDWGVENFLTLANESEQVSYVENPRFLKTALPKIKSIQEQLSQKKKASANRQKVKSRLCRFHFKIANCRLDFMHKKSSQLVFRSQRLITEKLSIKNITRSPHPKQDHQTGEYLPNGAARKAGLNRSILDTSPSQFLNMVRTKAEEAGYKLEELETKVLKPSQRCAQCGNIEKKQLSERTHLCGCGFQISRDANSALVMLRYSVGHLKWDDRKRSRGPALCLEMPQGISKHETPSIFTP